MKRAVIGVVGAVLLAGCTMPAERGPALVEHRHTLSSASAKSELLGFSLADVVPRRAFSAKLTWNPATPALHFAPSASVTHVHWSFELPAPGSELFRIDEVNVECDRSRFVTNTVICDDYLDATLILHVVTDDGALSESIPVDFKARSLADTTWQQPNLDTSHFTGSFTISAHAGKRDSLRLGGYGSVSQNSADGELLGDLVVEQKQDGTEGTSAGAVVTVAKWRSDDAPLLPAMGRSPARLPSSIP